jgi:hypothetical protein
LALTQPAGGNPGHLHQKGKIMETKEQTTGNRLKFKLEFMFLLLSAGRDEEAAKVYDQLIAEFDKLK